MPEQQTQTTSGIETGQSYYISGTINGETRYLVLMDGVISVGTESPDAHSGSFRATVNPENEEEFSLHLTDTESNQQGFVTVFTAANEEYELDLSSSESYFTIVNDPVEPNGDIYIVSKVIDDADMFLSMDSDAEGTPVDMANEEAPGEKTQKWVFAKTNDAGLRDTSNRD